MVMDRRRVETDRRTTMRVQAVFAVKSVARGRVQLGQAEDIGIGGLNVRHPKDQPLRPGTPVRLTFALPGQGEILRVDAVVIEDRGAATYRRTGLQFIDVPVGAAQKIEGFCRHAMSNHGDPYQDAYCVA